MVFAPASLILTNYFLPLNEALGAFEMKLGIQFLQILTLLTPFIVLTLRHYSVLPIKGRIGYPLISVVLVYFLYVGTVELSYTLLEAEVNSFDLDGNGSFSSVELTAEADLVMERYGNDTGRVFSKYVGFIVAVLFTGIIFSIAKAYTFIKTKVARKKFT